LTASNDIPNPFEQKAKQQKLIEEKMANVKHKIAIISGKGGVGKTLVTVNLAVALAAKGRKGKVGILDADLTGPCVPKMLGLKGHKMELGPAGIMPARGLEDIAVVSMDLCFPGTIPLSSGVVRLRWGPSGSSSGRWLGATLTTCSSTFLRVLEMRASASFSCCRSWTA
jgi:ATP-binding protein involved in chromosome partitioning